jgi:hypothetical protein
MGHRLPGIFWQDVCGVRLSTPRQTPNLEDQASVFVTPGDTSYAAIPPGHWVPILVAFYHAHELRWDYSYPLVTTQRIQYNQGDHIKEFGTVEHVAYVGETDCV